MKMRFKIIWFIVLLISFEQHVFANNPLDTNWRGYFSDYCEGMSHPVTDIFLDESGLYICGQFHQDRCAEHLSGVAMWRDSLWASIGRDSLVGVLGVPKCVIKRGDSIYIGGIIFMIDTFRVNSIAGWDMSTNPYTPITFGDGVYRTFSNDSISKRIGVINDMLFWEDTLIVAGVFDSAGTSRANCLAAWDGASWNDIGASVDGKIHTIKLDDSNLLVGGEFNTVYTSSSTMTVNNIASFNLSTRMWSSIGQGVNGKIKDIFIQNNNYFFGGTFDSVFVNDSAYSANNIVMWNGSIWDTLHGGVNGDVLSIDGDSLDVYVGGYFTIAGDTIANNIARYSNSIWYPLGSGTDGSVKTLKYQNETVYIGGSFYTTGTKESIHIGLWSTSNPPSPPLIYSTNIENSNTIFSKLSVRYFPNPVAEILNIELSLEKDSRVSLELFDINGIKITTILKNKNISKGIYNYQYDFDGVADGLCYGKLVVNEKVFSSLIVIIR